MYSIYSSLYIPLMRFSLPCMIYLCELLFPIDIHMQVLPNPVYLCELFLLRYITYACYASLYDLLMEVIHWGKFLKKFLGGKPFILSKSFPRKEVWKKQIFGQAIVMVAKSIPWKQLCKKTFLRKIFRGNCFWLQNHYHENRFAKKIRKNFGRNF